MDFRHFRTFVIAGEELHLGRTAERLGIAQPAVSQQIRALETTLGFALFHRVRRGVELTEAGAVFLDHARGALAHAEAAVLAGQRAHRGELGSITIGYCHSAMLEPELPALLQRFSHHHPDVTIELRSIGVQEQVAALVDGRIDVAFIRSPPGPVPESVHIAPFSRTLLDAVLPAGHGAGDKAQVSLRELAADRFLTLDDPPGIGLGQRVLELCHAAGFEPRTVLRVTDAVTVVTLVSAGLGVGLVPRTLARYAVEGAVFMPLEQGNCYSEMLIASRAYERSPSARQLLALAADMAAGH